MRTWERSVIGFMCGNCAAMLPAGAPVLRLMMPNIKHVKVRCAECAGEPVPADLLALAARAARAAVRLTYVDDDGIERPIAQGRLMTPVKQQADRFDWRAAAAKVSVE